MPSAMAFSNFCVLCRFGKIRPHLIEHVLAKHLQNCVAAISHACQVVEYSTVFGEISASLPTTGFIAYSSKRERIIHEPGTASGDVIGLTQKIPALVRS